MLSREEARAFYDRFGAKQDRQGRYEDPPLRELIARADPGAAEAVFEFGCGTGRFAAELLERHLSATATYLGCDLSSTMVALATERLARFGERAEVRLSDGEPRAPLPDASVDRFLTTYVLDLLPAAEVAAVAAEARRVLRPGGLFGVTGLTPGNTLVSRVTSTLWVAVQAVAPRLVGGCRPLRVLDHVDRDAWELVHAGVVVAAGIPSEVVVLRVPAETG